MRSVRFVTTLLFLPTATLRADNQPESERLEPPAEFAKGPGEYNLTLSRAQIPTAGIISVRVIE